MGVKCSVPKHNTVHINKNPYWNKWAHAFLRHKMLYFLCFATLRPLGRIFPVYDALGIYASLFKNHEKLQVANPKYVTDIQVLLDVNRFWTLNCHHIPVSISTSSCSIHLWLISNITETLTQIPGSKVT